MNCLPFAFVLMFLTVASYAASSPEMCTSAGQQCVNTCCSSNGGSASGEDFPCTLYTDAGEEQYMACHSGCVANRIRCLAPASGCEGQYRSCASGCSGDTGQVWSCMKGCALSGTACASSAATPTPGGDGSCCCGGGFILAGLALAGITLASKR